MAESPIGKYLVAQTAMDNEMATHLKDAANEAGKIAEELATRAGVGAQVRRREMVILRRELLNLSESYWTGITSVVERNYARAAVAAVDADQAGNRALWRAVGGNIPQYDAAVALKALNNVETLRARALNGIPLSDQVYRTKALADGLVDRQITRSLLLGESAQQMAARVKGMIRPDVRGGVSYAAYRLGRTELNNAFHRTQIALAATSPWVTSVQWHLSGSHPKPDACNDYAEKTHFKGGEAGHFRPGEVPSKPHPQCLCYTTSSTVDEDEFINQFVSGGYTPHIERTIYENFPNTVC